MVTIVYINLVTGKQESIFVNLDLLSVVLTAMLNAGNTIVAITTD